MQTKSKCAAGQRYVLLVFGGLMVLCSLFLAIVQHSLAAMGSPILFGSVLLVIGLLFGFYGYQFRRLYRKAPLLRDRRTLDVDDQALRFRTANSESRTPWEAYIKFAENKDTFIVFQQGNQIFIPIPKRELSSAKIDELRSVLEAHLPRK